MTGLDVLLAVARTKTDPAASAGALPFESDIEALIARQKALILADAKKLITPWIVAGVLTSLLSLGVTVYLVTRKN